jgi:hypothetical protein
MLPPPVATSLFDESKITPVEGQSLLTTGIIHGVRPEMVDGLCGLLGRGKGGTGPYLKIRADII